MRVISLSTIPPRFDAVGGTLKNLLAQRDPADEIHLYIPRHYRRFPDYDGNLPTVPDGVTIIRTDNDLGPASKILFAAKSLRGRPARILFCDDDISPPKDWSCRLFAAQNERPSDCIAAVGKQIPHRIPSGSERQPRAIKTSLGGPAYIAKRGLYLLGLSRRKAQRSLIAKSGYADIFQGYGGVVIRPDFFDDRAFDIPPILWAVDDYWLSGCLELAGIGIWLQRGIEMPASTDASTTSSLLGSVLDGASRGEANEKCIRYMQEHHKIWL